MSRLPKVLTPLDLHKERILFRLLLILFSLPILILGFSHFDSTQETSLLDQLTLNPSFLESEGEGHLLRFEGSYRSAELPIVFPQPITQSQKIKIEYTKTNNLKALRLVIPQVSNRKNSYLHQARIIDEQSGSITFGLNSTNARQITLVMYGDKKRNKAPIEIKISSMSVSERRFIDSNLFFIILMLGVSSSLLLIGVITGACLQKICGYDSRSSGIFLFLGVFVYSILLFLALFLFQFFFPQGYTNSLLVFAIFLTCALAVCYLKTESTPSQESFLATIRVPVILYLIFTAIVAALVGCIDGIALQEYYWSLIGKYRMFDGHRAHDNVFQYLNAVAIAENKSFNYFYKAPQLVRHLIFDVEDRQVLMGTILGAYRVLWGTLSAYTTNTFGFFTIIGSCFSLLIIFPLYTFFRRYYKGYIVALAILLLFMTTYVLGNIYYTWFKTLGGGCILAGVYFLHFYKNSLKSWLIAGFFWGLAINMHSGQAIIYPLLAIYFFYQSIGKCSFSTIIKSGLFTAALTLVVILAMLPWEVIKHYYFPNTSDLFRMHFLHGQHFAGSMTQTIFNFFSDRYTLAEQLSHRSQQLIEALRLKDIQTWYAKLNVWQIKDYLLSWNRLQFRYITIMVYPLLILFTITVAAGKFIPHTWTEKSSTDHRPEQLNRLFILSVACVIWGLLIMFTKSETISSSFVSQFATLFILMFLHCSIAAYSRIGLTVMLLYCCLSFSKLYLYFSKVIDFSSLL